MKKCTNCGADYDSKLLNCPYCGNENAEAVQEAYHDKIEELVEEREEMIDNLPKKVVRKKTQIAIIVMIIAIIGAICAVVLTSINTKAQKEVEATAEQRNKEILEEYLSCGDYAGFFDFFEELKNAYGGYDKYWSIWRVYSAYNNYSNPIIDKAYDKSYVNSLGYENACEFIRSDLSYFNIIFIYAKEEISDDIRHDREKHIEAICELAKKYFFERYPLCDEQLMEKVIEVEYEEWNDHDKFVLEFDEMAKEICDTILNEE